MFLLYGPEKDPPISKDSMRVKAAFYFCIVEMLYRANSFFLLAVDSPGAVALESSPGNKPRKSSEKRERDREGKRREREVERDRHAHTLQAGRRDRQIEKREFADTVCSISHQKYLKISNFNSIPLNKLGKNTS